MSDRDPVVSVWCGFPRFACPECAFDSLDEANVLSHIETAHPLPAPKPYPEPAVEPEPEPTTEPDVPADTVTPDDPEESTTDG